MDIYTAHGGFILFGNWNTFWLTVSAQPQLCFQSRMKPLCRPHHYSFGGSWAPQAAWADHMEKYSSTLGCRNAEERMMELSGIPAPWTWPKTLHFVYTVLISSTSRDRIQGSHTDWPAFPKTCKWKIPEWSNQQRVRLSQSMGWGLWGTSLPSLPWGSPGCDLL